MQAGGVLALAAQGHVGLPLHSAGAHLLRPAQHVSLGARDAQVQDPLLLLRCLKKARPSGIAVCARARVCLCVGLQVALTARDLGSYSGKM